MNKQKSILIAVLCLLNTNLQAKDGDANSQVARSQDLRSKIFRESFTVPAGEKSVSQAAVRKLLNQLDAMVLKPKKAPPKPTPAVVVMATAEVNVPVVKEAVKEKPVDLITKETLERLEGLTKDPNQVAEPIALAGTLFECGQFKYAAKFYEVAVERESSQGRKLSIDDKAWMLLQIAQCRKDEPAEAVKALDKLLELYPNSTWSRAAYVKKEMLQWLATEKPVRMVGEAK